ncbi:MAG: S8 family serine peptidase, partial [Catalinimonas sp.]
MLRFAACLLFGLLTLTAAAQSEADYLPKTVVIKVRPEFRAACTPTSIEEPALRAALQSLRGEVKKMFPRHQDATKPAARTANASAVDLSLIYRIEYAADVPLPKAIARLHHTGRLVYAEPYYIHRTQFQPNDPNLALQINYLNVIGLFDAWDITTGDTTVTIAVVDSGTDWDHHDLVDNIAYNWDDPIDGLDNDNDGYVDNFHGWDLAGADFANSQEDNDPNITGNNNNHGTHVSGIAAATTDNDTGVAGVGFRCKLLPIKAAADNDERSRGRGLIIAGYQGIVYAADQGADVINCSWGGPARSFFGQDVIDYATSQNSLVVAAAGNSNLNQAFYPAAFEGALSVTWTDSEDRKANSANYHTSVDISAPGVRIYSTYWDETYGFSDGSSMASPIVAGAAALVKAEFPDYTARQLGEQLRITSDASFYDVGNNRNFEGLLGRGRLNVLRALTERRPAVRAS